MRGGCLGDGGRRAGLGLEAAVLAAKLLGINGRPQRQQGPLARRPAPPRTAATIRPRPLMSMIGYLSDSLTRPCGQARRLTALLPVWAAAEPGRAHLDQLGAPRGGVGQEALVADNLHDGRVGVQGSTGRTAAHRCPTLRVADAAAHASGPAPYVPPMLPGGWFAMMCGFAPMPAQGPAVRPGM